LAKFFKIQSEVRFDKKDFLRMFAAPGVKARAQKWAKLSSLRRNHPSPPGFVLVEIGVHWTKLGP